MEVARSKDNTHVHVGLSILTMRRPHVSCECLASDFTSCHPMFVRDSIVSKPWTENPCIEGTALGEIRAKGPRKICLLLATQSVSRSHSKEKRLPNARIHPASRMAPQLLRVFAILNANTLFEPRAKLLRPRPGALIPTAVPWLLDYKKGVDITA